MVDGNYPLEEAGRDSSGSRPADRSGPYRVEGPLDCGDMGEGVRDLIVAITHTVVVFSIVVQGLALAPLLRRVVAKG